MKLSFFRETEEPDDDAAGEVSDDEAEEAELYEAMNYNIEEDDDADAAEQGGEPDAGQQDSRPADDVRAPQHDEQLASDDVPMGHAVPDGRQATRLCCGSLDSMCAFVHFKSWVNIVSCHPGLTAPALNIRREELVVSTIARSSTATICHNTSWRRELVLMLAVRTPVVHSCK